jgi:hypothetical protein
VKDNGRTAAAIKNGIESGEVLGLRKIARARRADAITAYSAKLRFEVRALSRQMVWRRFAPSGRKLDQALSDSAERYNGE